jgi:hypothetical protein
MTAAVEDRLARLESIEAIRHLKARYCQTADEPAGAREFADLFLEDGVLDEGEDFMILRGRKQIFRAHEASWRHMRMNQHLAISPTIEVDGDQATGRWKLLQLITIQSPDDNKPRAFWSCGWYQEQYQNTAQGWLFRHVEARIHFCSSYEKGWAKSPFEEMLAPGALTEILLAVEGES